MDPHTIPNGYDVEKHRALSGTIATGVASLGAFRVMACHESSTGREKPCVGWLVNQLGPGNNLGVRLAVMLKRIDGNVRTVGPQHDDFKDTLP